MLEITLKIDGMMCSMCEAHINDAIRKEHKVQRVASSHSKGETVIVAEEEISEEALKTTVEKTGYKLLAYGCKPYQKKGFLGKLFKG